MWGGTPCTPSQSRRISELEAKELNVRSIDDPILVDSQLTMQAAAKNSWAYTEYFKLLGGGIMTPNNKCSVIPTLTTKYLGTNIRWGNSALYSRYLISSKKDKLPVAPCNFKEINAKTKESEAYQLVLDKPKDMYTNCAPPSYFMPQTSH